MVVASSSVTIRVTAAGTPAERVRVETGAGALDLTEDEWRDLCVIVRAVQAAAESG